MTSLAYVLLVLLVLLSIPGLVTFAFLLSTNDNVVFFGDSISFAGSVSETGFINRIRDALGVHSDTMKINMHGAGQLEFDANVFVVNQLPSLLKNYAPSVAILMISDDELDRILLTWLVEDDKKHSQTVECGYCEHYEDIAVSKLKPLVTSFTLAIAQILELAPECRIVLTTPVLGAHDSVVGHSFDDGWGSEGARRKDVLRERFVAMIKQLSFDFSPPPIHEDQDMSHYHGGYQYSQNHLEVIDVGHILTRFKENVQYISGVGNTIESHTRNGMSHKLDDLGHAIIASTIGSHMRFEDDINDALRLKVIEKLRYTLRTLLVGTDVSVDQITLWQHDSQSSMLKQLQERLDEVKQLQIAHHAQRKKEEKMYSEPIQLKDNPERVKNAASRNSKRQRRRQRNEL